MSSLLFISGLNFSTGGAAQSRQLSMMRGLCTKGFDLTLLNLQSVFPDAVPFPVRTLPKVSRHLSWRISLLIFYIPILSLALLRKRSAVFCYDRDAQIIVPVIFLARVFGVKVFHEITEFPSVVKPRGVYGWITVLLYERFCINKLDGVVVISHALVDYVKTLSRRSKVLLVPGIAKFSENHERIVNTAGQTFNFVYTGSFSEQKDGVISLARAFSEVYASNKVATLTLYGNGSSGQLEELRSTVNALNLEHVVKIEPPVAQVEIPSILFAADALVLCRPYSKQALGGFPTKLAEYLASSRPVITTITGDIGRYLEHGLSAYLVPANDIHAFAEQMLAVIGQHEQNERVGLEGGKSCRQYFDVELSADRVGDWLRYYISSGDYS